MAPRHRRVQCSTSDQNWKEPYLGSRAGPGDHHIKCICPATLRNQVGTSAAPGTFPRGRVCSVGWADIRRRRIGSSPAHLLPRRSSNVATFAFHLPRNVADLAEYRPAVGTITHRPDAILLSFPRAGPRSITCRRSQRRPRRIDLPAERPYHMVAMTIDLDPAAWLATLYDAAVWSSSLYRVVFCRLLLSLHGLALRAPVTSCWHEVPEVGAGLRWRE